MVSNGYVKFRRFFTIYCLSLSYGEMVSVCHLVAETSDMTNTERDYLLSKITNYYKNS